MQKRNGTRQNGELEIFYADTPLGPWQPHALNPVMNGDRRAGARMGGRIVPFEGKLLRFGQDGGFNYGHKVGIPYIMHVMLQLLMCQESQHLAPSSNFNLNSRPFPAFLPLLSNMHLTTVWQRVPFWQVAAVTCIQVAASTCARISAAVLAVQPCALVRVVLPSWCPPARHFIPPAACRWWPTG